MNQNKFDFDVDPQFSVFRVLNRSKKHFSILYHTETLKFISHAIENMMFDINSNFPIFVGFQRFSHFLPQIKRYHEIAEHVHHVYILGVADAELPEINNLTYVPVSEEAQIAKEWFLLSYGRDFFTALANEEIVSQSNKREFVGIWSFDQNLVSILYEWLNNEVGDRYDHQNIYKHHAPKWKHQNENLNKIMLNVIRKIDETDDVQLKDELENVIHRALYPAIHDSGTDRDDY